MIRIGQLMDRCERICGRGERRCFVSDRRQFNCIADMVVNKVAGIREIVETARDVVAEGEAEEALRLAADDLGALTEWVRYLRVVQDLKSLREELRVGRHRRKDTRYCLPPSLRDYIRLRVVPADGTPQPVRLVDFSRRGIRFRSTAAFRPGQRCACAVSIATAPSRDSVFRIEIRHCRPDEEGFVVGAALRNDDDAAFRVFRKIYDFIVDGDNGVGGRADG